MLGACETRLSKGSREQRGAGGARLVLIQKLYQVKTEAMVKGPTHAQCANLRVALSQMLLAEFNRLAMEVCGVAFPESAVGKAVTYQLDRGPQLGAYAQPRNGHLEIDNNPVKGGIRPTAQGKEIWLFIGQTAAGWRNTEIYSIVSTFKVQGVNPYRFRV